MQLQLASLDVLPGVKLSTTVPFTQEVEPVEAHAPVPQAVGLATSSSSASPSQSSSMPLHYALLIGLPGVQLSTTVPFTQEVEPVEAHAPVPQEVGLET